MASHENNLGILSVEVTTVCETWVRLLLRHVTLERSLLLLERVQLRNPVDDVRVLVDLAARHPLSLELRLLGHDVLLQLLHVFELLLGETLRRLLLLLLRSEDQLRRHRCHVVLACPASAWANRSSYSPPF